MNKLGIVNDIEKEEIESIFRKRLAIEHLFTILHRQEVDLEDSDTFSKLVSEMSVVLKETQEWWERVAFKYKWQFSKSDQWNIDFQTNTIYLTTIPADEKHTLPIVQS